MADLIDSARAKYNIAQSTYTAAQNTTIAALVTAASKQIKKICRREFDSQTFDQLYRGEGYYRLNLRQFPIISVARVACGKTTVLRVRNSSSGVQRATVALTDTACVLTRVVSGTTTTNTLTLADADKDTIGELATAITAVGNGWTAEAVTQYANWPSQDLSFPQGAYNAAGGAVAEIWHHVEELSDYEIEAAQGQLLRGSYESRYDEHDNACWTEGVSYRVVYTAGFATVPEDVQEACAQFAAALYWQTMRDPGLRQESIPGQVFRTPILEGSMPGQVRDLIRPYIKRRV